MKLVIFLAFRLFILNPVSALIEMFTLSKLWAWFAAAQYGAGPTDATLYGLVLMATTVVCLALVGMNVATKGQEEASYATSIATTVGVWLGCFLALGAAFVTGAILGWIP
jgi:hypothetical protein